MSNNDIETLKQIAHASSTAVRFFTWMALRERNRGPINIVKTKRSLRNDNEPINDVEFERALTDLVKAGYGKLIKNHRGEPVYFQLHHPIYQIGKAAIEGKPLSVPKARKVPLTPRKVVPHMVRPNITLAVNNKTTRTVMYYLVNGQRMKMEFEGEVPTATLEKIIATLTGQHKQSAAK